MIFSLFIPARFYKEGWWRDNMTEKLRLWLWRGLSEARQPDDANSHRAEDRLFHNDRLCLHFINGNILQTFLSVSTSLIRNGVGLFYTHINNLLHILTQNVMAEKLQENCPIENFGSLWHHWVPSFGSPCFWLPLSLHWGTHIFDKTRGYRFPMPVNGSLCYYDYVKPCASGTSLNHRTRTCL